MLSNSRILAQGIFGTHTVVLLQADSTYLLVLGTYTKKNSFSVIDQRILTREEALQALEYIHAQKRNGEHVACALLQTPESNIEESVILLETKSEEKKATPYTTKTKVVVSPYFPTKEIFLATQMTCAPNMY